MPSFSHAQRDRQFPASYRFGLMIGLALLMAACEQQSRGPRVDVTPLLEAEGVVFETATLLVRRQSDGAEWYSNEGRLEQRYSPASTAKIPHTYIALESGVATPETQYAWDGKERAISSWNQAQTLSTAYERSAVWVYQAIAQTLGHTTMAEWIDLTDFGNQNIGTPEDLTTYWLRGPLAVSANEQVRFLVTVAQEELPFSPGTYRAARDIMTEAQGEGWTLYAKTGLASRNGRSSIGWYVGWVDTVDDRGKTDTYYFALNIDILSPEDIGKRQSAVQTVLRQIGVLS